MNEDSLDFDLTFKEADVEAPTVEEQVIVNSIKNFTDEGSQPDKKVYTNLYDAFDLEVTNKNGDTVKFKMQKNAGSFIPTITGMNHTDLNVIKTKVFKGEIDILQIAHELELDINKIEDKLIDPSLAISQVQEDLETMMMMLMISGSAVDDKTKQQINLLKNSLFDVGEKKASELNLATANANEIIKYLNDRVSAVEDISGETPDTLLISNRIWRSIGTADTNLANFIVPDYIREQLGINVFKTSLLDNVNDGADVTGACMVLYKKDPSMLKGYIGKPPFVRNDKKTNLNEYPAIFCSIGGFVNLTGKKGSVDITTNLFKK